MSTRGIQELEKSKAPFEVVQYDHLEKGAAFAAQAVGFDLAQTIKTLVVAVDSGRYVLVLMPGDRQVSMKKVAGACNAKRAAMADTQTAQRLTGYLIGGISPFGAKKKLPVIMEATLQNHAEVMINAGQRGTMIKITPGDIIRMLNPTTTDLVLES
jgi:Cys-tRNA(Pro)/Cys-tRNA(Cys) deacylase